MRKITEAIETSKATGQGVRVTIREQYRDRAEDALACADGHTDTVRDGKHYLLSYGTDWKVTVEIL